jgi:hypothetical protein
MPSENPRKITGMSPPPARLVKVRFGNYDVTVKIGPSNEFLGIEEIGVPKSFLSLQQRRNAVGHHDVNDLYEEK